MQRELLLVDEMIGAAEQARALVNGVTLETLEDDRLRRDALLWNFTVIGEAASQLGPEIRSRFPDIDWAKPGKPTQPHRSRLLVRRSRDPSHDRNRRAPPLRRTVTASPQ